MVENKEYDPEKVQCLKDKCGCRALNAEKYIFSTFDDCYNDETTACAQMGDKFDQANCYSDAYLQCQGDTTLAENFGCAEGLTIDECTDLYTITIFNGKMDESKLIEKLTPAL